LFKKKRREEKKEKSQWCTIDIENFLPGTSGNRASWQRAIIGDSMFLVEQKMVKQLTLEDVALVLPFLQNYETPYSIITRYFTSIHDQCGNEPFKPKKKLIQDEYNVLNDDLQHLDGSYKFNHKGGCNH
jgi:hypothetical protein